MGIVVYLLCAAAAFLCCALLARAYSRTRMRLLLWSAACFLCLTVNNVLVVIDLAVFPEVDLFLFRNAVALLGVVALLYGLIWDAR